MAQTAFALLRNARSTAPDGAPAEPLDDDGVDGVDDGVDDEPLELQAVNANDAPATSSRSRQTKGFSARDIDGAFPDNRGGRKQ